MAGIGNPKGTNRGGGPRKGTKIYHPLKNGEVWVEHKKKCSLLQGWIDNKGYRSYTIDGKWVSAHRYIAETFIPNPLGLEQIDHINRVRHDNRVENLRWVSRSQNCENRVFGGTTQQAIDYLLALGYTITPP